MAARDPIAARAERWLRQSHIDWGDRDVEELALLLHAERVRALRAAAAAAQHAGVVADWPEDAVTLVVDAIRALARRRGGR